MTPFDPMDNDFTRHLNRCRQCRENPFALCSEGERLIQQAARELREAQKLLQSAQMGLDADSNLAED